MSIKGSQYFVTFIDDYTRHTWVCLIEKKSEVCSCFLKVKNLAEQDTCRKIKCQRSDDTKEYFSNQLSSYLQKEGFDMNSLAYTHQSITVGPRERIGQ